MGRRLHTFLTTTLAALALTGCADQWGAITLPSVIPQALTDADYYPVLSDTEVELGRFLFYDKILSGNDNISCAPCHDSKAGTSDALSLSISCKGGKTRMTGISNIVAFIRSSISRELRWGSK